MSRSIDVTASLSGENQGTNNFALDLYTHGECVIEKVEFRYFNPQGVKVKLEKVDPCSFAQPNEDCFSESFPWVLKPEPGAPLIVEGARSLKVCQEALPLTLGYTPGFRVYFVEAVVHVRGRKQPVTTPRMSLRISSR